jgi:hypothetical protein
LKHALTHEVAYGSLLQERRRALHARIVEALEAHDLERLGGQVEALAHHAFRTYGDVRTGIGLRSSRTSAAPFITSATWALAVRFLAASQIVAKIDVSVGSEGRGNLHPAGLSLLRRPKVHLRHVVRSSHTQPHDPSKACEAGIA